jgi:hypothetical protein
MSEHGEREDSNTQPASLESPGLPRKQLEVRFVVQPSACVRRSESLTTVCVHVLAWLRQRV